MRFQVLSAVALLATTLFGTSAWAQTDTALTNAANSPKTDTVESSIPKTDSVTLDNIKNTFQERFVGIEVTNIRATPINNIYEVQIGLDIVYVDETVDHVFQGRLIDAHTQTDLTDARIQNLSAVSFDSLPFDLAVKIVRGDGTQKVAVFEDPNCPYCKQLHKSLKEIDNLTIYSFLYPILSVDSVTKSKNILCAKNSDTVLMDWMLNNKEPASVECDSHNIQELLDAGKNLSVRGTPAIFFTDGGRASGALPAAQLKQRLEVSN